MMLPQRLWLALFLVNVIAAMASGSTVSEMVVSMQTLAYGLGWLMMVIMGIKWIIADSPNERADSKKGMIYIIIGLLIVRSACNLITLYCDNAYCALGASATTFSCPLGDYGCSGWVPPTCP